MPVKIDTIEDALSQDDPGRIEIKGKVCSMVENGSFYFLDQTKHCSVKIMNPGLKSNPLLKEGTFVKLVCPLVSEDKSCLLLTEKSRIIPTQKIKALLEVQSPNVDSIDTEESFEIGDLTTLAEVKLLDSETVSINCIMNHFVVKALISFFFFL